MLVDRVTWRLCRDDDWLGIRMSPFELAEPASLAEALALLDREDSAVRAIAGGTALMLMMKSGLYRARRLVSLRRLQPALDGIRIAADGGLEIGAMDERCALRLKANGNSGSRERGAVMADRRNVSGAPDSDEAG